MQRIEKHIIKKDKQLDNISWLSKNLYNYTNYIIRQAFTGKHAIYSGKRVKRGLFKSSIGRYINSDVNGSLNILRKVIGDEFVKDLLANRGAVLSPYKMSSFIKEGIS